MTFDDDYIQLNQPNGPIRFTCKSAGFSWPPPAELEIESTLHGVIKFKRLSYSSLTDEQRAGMTHVCRMAQYEEWGRET